MGSQMVCDVGKSFMNFMKQYVIRSHFQYLSFALLMPSPLCRNILLGTFRSSFVFIRHPQRSLLVSMSIPAPVDSMGKMFT